jgi:galactose-1-phosphate uridylyltransferase
MSKVQHNNSMRRDPTDLRRQEQEAQRDERAAKAQRDKEIEDFKEVVRTKQGRRFIWRLLEEAGVYRSSFTGTSQTFFLEGQRNMGLLLIREIHEICPDVYTTMLKEQESNDN